MSDFLNSTLNNIRIVLIRTTHSGNIGSTARAMKTMGLRSLYLVNPKNRPDEQAVAMSSNAKDVLDNAHIVATLPEALEGCRVVIGSSARQERSLSWDIIEPRECALKLVEQAQDGKVALVFGTESSGLSNDELAYCQHLVNIPTNPDYSSLNLASAVQLLSYECRLAAMQSDNVKTSRKWGGVPEKSTVTADEMEGYYQHLEESMIESGFLDPKSPKHLMTRLRRLYGRVELTKSELNILRGMLASFKKK